MATKYVTLKDSNGDTLYPQAVATNLAPGSITTDKLAATTLFSGFQTGGTVDLSDNISNYQYIEIYAQEIGNRKIYTKVKTPAVGDRVIVFGVFPTTGGIYVRTSVWTWGTNTLAWTESRDQQITTTSTPGSTNANVSILKIVGYK